MFRIIFFLFIIVNMNGAREISNYPVSPVKIKDVILNDNFWLPKIKLVQDTTIGYALTKCLIEGRMENFLVAGGKKKGTYTGKMPFDDTDLYKIIEGASYSLVSKPNAELDSYIDRLVTIIQVGQEADGYLTTWFSIDPQKPPAWWVNPSSRRWENIQSSHELYNSGHLFEAASAHYWATGKKTLLDIALKNADLLVQNFAPGKLSDPPGHQIVETGLIKLYHITNNRKYLELARYFLDLRGDSTTHKLYGEYSQDHLPVIKQNEGVGHAVRALYMYAAMTDIAVMDKDEAYLNAVNAIWENIVNKKMYITGGLGSKHGKEAFGDNYELPNLTAYNETCAAIANVYWNQRLFLLTGHSKFYDIIERTLYNGLLAGISLDGKNFFYPNPTESDGSYTFNMGSCSREPWFDCSCCPTNLIRFIPSIPGLIYATRRDSLFINLFVSNNAHISLDEEKIGISQQTDYPWNGHIKVSVNPEKEKDFTLKLRIPGWALANAVPGDLYSYQKSEHGTISVKVNGIDQRLKLNKGYVELSRLWMPGDFVELDLPNVIHKVAANKKVRDDSNKVAIEYGPFVYCAEEVDNKRISEIMIPDNMHFNIQEKMVLSEKVLSINSKVDDVVFTWVPYYLWSNRGAGKMKVWFPREYP